ncbi:MAG: helix-turn-helix domain-containing protein [Actinobacteria bacterium]|nr:helix-turn-helix domain-containing protein [Actinomycetota bacterium]MBI3687703.1 helix-turn-helix domain-containing protein [Actinomycetota bacterium]
MSVSGPTIVRRQLGRRLRQTRIGAGKKIDDVSVSGVVSKATLHRYESGRVAVTPGTVLELSLLYGLDRPTTLSLYELAVGSQSRGWWEDKETLSATSMGFYIGLESAASVIQSYMPDVILGLVQTADYAREVERAHESDPDEEAVERRVAIRMQRKEIIFGRTPPVRLQVVLGPGALARQVGGPAVMAGQLAHLRELAADDRVELRILPWESGAHAAMAGGFTLMRFEDPDDPTVVYVESAVGSSYFELPDQVARYARIIDHVYPQSVPFEEHPV